MNTRNSEGAGRGGGGGYSFVACLSRLSIDHASLSRRHAVPILLIIEIPPAFGRPLRFFHVLHKRHTYRNRLRFTLGLRIYPPNNHLFGLESMISLIYPRGNRFFRKKNKSPLFPDLPPGYVFLPEIPPGADGFRVRCSVPQDFRVDTEHLCRSTPSHSAPIRTLLPGVAQIVKLLTGLVRGAPSASGHLAQRERRV